jgi:hypothetical protein
MNIIIIAGARNKTINFIGIGSCLKPDSVRTKIVRKKIKPYAFLHLRSWSGDNEVFRAIKIRLIVSLNAKIKQQKQEHYGCEFKPGEVVLFFSTLWYRFWFTILLCAAYRAALVRYIKPETARDGSGGHWLKNYVQFLNS